MSDRRVAFALAAALASTGCEAPLSVAPPPVPDKIVIPPPPPPPVVPPFVMPTTTPDSPERAARREAIMVWAKYLNAMHDKLHPIFADHVLPRLDREQRVTDPSLYAVIEIVLDPANGRIVRRALLKSSASPEFDAAVPDTVDKAAPFEAAPAVMVSYDGDVHVHWEFHRNHTDACTTRNAFPVLLKDPAAAPAKASP